MLVTRDGNNQLIILAWMVCLVENSKNYEYLALHCKKVSGLSDYLDRPQALLYSDRHKGIPAFEKVFQCGKANCIVHIIDNIRDACKKYPGANVGFHAEQIHKIQQCHTRKEYDRKLALFAKGYPECAAYVDALPHETTFLYAIMEAGFTTHGHRTSNIAEIVNNVLRDARYYLR